MSAIESPSVPADGETAQRHEERRLVEVRGRNTRCAPVERAKNFNATVDEPATPGGGARATPERSHARPPELLERQAVHFRAQIEHRSTPLLFWRGSLVVALVSIAARMASGSMPVYR